MLFLFDDDDDDDDDDDVPVWEFVLLLFFLKLPGQERNQNNTMSPSAQTGSHTEQGGKENPISGLKIVYSHTSPHET